MVPGMLEISDEVVLMIFEQVSQIAPQALVALCLVSHRFCRLSSSLLYRSISLPSGRLQQNEAADPGSGAYTFQGNILTYARHLTIENELDWTIFSDVLARMTRLESIRWLYWEDPFPAIIKKCLHKTWPDAKLLIDALSIGFRTDAEEVQADDLNLLKSPVSCRNIHSVKVEIEYEHPVTMRWLKDVLLSSQKLKILHLTLPRERNGKVMWLADGLGSYDLCVQPGERLGPLVELVYEGRMAVGDPRPVIPTSFFDFTRIRHLELRGPIMDRFLINLKDQSLCVETLTLEYFSSFYPGREVLERILPRIPGVQNLRIITTSTQGELPLSTIFSLGGTLKHLELRPARDDSDPYPIGVSQDSYSPDDLDDLRNACSQISLLVVEMQIHDTLPYDFLAALARFPQLSSVRIYFQFKNIFGSSRRDTKPPHISTDRLTALHIFSYLRDHKIGVPLEGLEVVMSDRPRLSRRIWHLSHQDRPGMRFTCREDKRGNLIVEDDFDGNEDVSWWSYFDPERPKQSPGQTYPDNLLEIIEAGEEANRIMSDVGKVTAQRDDLFEESQGLAA